MKASPAPTVSTTAIGMAATEKEKFRVATTAPRSLCHDEQLGGTGLGAQQPAGEVLRGV
jgi:hypothetical protein